MTGKTNKRTQTPSWSLDPNQLRDLHNVLNSKSSSSNLDLSRVTLLSRFDGSKRLSNCLERENRQDRDSGDSSGSWLVNQLRLDQEPHRATVGHSSSAEESPSTVNLCSVRGPRISNPLSQTGLPHESEDMHKSSTVRDSGFNSGSGHSSIPLDNRSATFGHESRSDASFCLDALHDKHICPNIDEKVNRQKETLAAASRLCSLRGPRTSSPLSQRYASQLSKDRNTLCSRSSVPLEPRRATFAYEPISDVTFDRNFFKDESIVSTIHGNVNRFNETSATVSSCRDLSRFIVPGPKTSNPQKNVLEEDGRRLSTIRLSQSTLYFGFVGVQDIAQKEVTIENFGNVAGRFSLTIKGSSAFKAEESRIKIPAKSQATLSVSFTPNKVGNDFQATLELRTTECEKTYKILLLGHGGTAEIDIIGGLKTLRGYEIPLQGSNSTSFSVKNIGQRSAFVLIKFYDAKEKQINLTSSKLDRAYVLKPTWEQEIPISASFLKDVRILVFWGEEAQRQRMKALGYKCDENMDFTGGRFLGEAAENPKIKFVNCKDEIQVFKQQQRKITLKAKKMCLNREESEFLDPTLL
ncbi:hypothetical protein L596_010345 [Steinernema carpocapsae]|uniref:Cep192/Spd-2-like domain-containing protein n=1 Tax=Steinernema carpocapsae TaxID=34508 RepID=A0A4V6A6V8_STECR|nr:hypothetical protein L596_010345 [Steinernema carpocapsae]